jgi:hypothetical protein
MTFRPFSLDWVLSERSYRTTGLQLETLCREWTSWSPSPTPCPLSR